MLAWALIIAGAIASFEPLLASGPASGLLVSEQNVPVSDPRFPELPPILADNDAIFHAALVGRNAWTLAHRPTELFRAEHCAPFDRSLALSHSMFTMSLLGLPFEAAGNPVLTYNAALVLMTLIAAAAMLALVRAWTGSVVAAIVASTLYAFHYWRLAVIHQPNNYDTAWLVLALHLYMRVVRGAGWPTALALGGSVVLQAGASFYALIGSLLVAGPPALWALLRFSPSRRAYAQLGVAGLIAASGVLALYAPYLDVRTQAGGLDRDLQVFAHVREFLPGELYFPGLLVLVLAAAGLALPGSTEEPRWPLAGRRAAAALAAGALLAAAVALGPNLGGVDLYRVAKAVLPGLEAVRVPSTLSSSCLPALCIVAGLGAARLLLRLPVSLSPMVRRAAAALLIAAAVGSTWADPFGTARDGYRVIRPPVDPDVLALFDELAVRAPEGAVIELPLDDGDLARLRFSPGRMLLAAYHHRRTSACYAGFLPPGYDELAQVIRRLPEAEALAAVRLRGFGAILVHGPPDSELVRTFESAVGAGTPGLRGAFVRGAGAGYEVLPE